MSGAEGVLVTGAYGAGKSSVVEEMAGMLEAAGTPYGAIDLDWLLWFDAAITDADREGVFLANLDAVVRNYLAAGVAHFMLAGAVRTGAALAAIRRTLPFPLRVVRLVVPLGEIEARLGTAVTAGRKDDLRVAREWLAEDIGAGIEDVAVDNHRPVAVTAAEVLAWLGWLRAG